jgi:MFS family permease
LKTIISLSYGTMALTSLWITILMLSQPSDNMIIGSIVVQAALLGCCNGMVGILNWEALQRGVSENARGKALGLAYGLGPVFAVVASVFTQLLLDGKLFEFNLPHWLFFDNYRYNYAILFGGSTICMFLATILVHFYRIPLPKVDVERESFSVAIFGGFKSMISNRVLLFACVAYLLVYCGNMVQNNMNIFTMESVGRAPQDLVGYQLALRFSFKILAGFLLGWLLTRTNPRAPLLVTVGLQIVSILWVLFVPGYWFMLAFGIMGAGELFGVYYINYPVCCSPKSQVRRNIAFLSLISSLVGLSPVLYGWISDTWNLRASFWTAMAIMVLATILVLFKLPSNPKPRPEDLTAADLAEEV